MADTTTTTSGAKAPVKQTVISNTAPIVPMQYIGSKAPTPVLQLDKLGQDSHVMSVMSTEVNLFNGNVVGVGALTADMETFNATAVDSSTDMVALIGFTDVDPVEYIPNDERYLPIGRRGRAYVLHRGDIITLSNLGISGEPVEGSYLVPQGYDITVASAKPASGVCFRCVGTEVLAGYQASILMVVQA